MLLKKVIVHRNGTDHGPYEPLAICEMLHKGQLLQQDHARLENGAEWKSLETLLPEIVGRIVVTRGGTEYGPYDPYLVEEMVGNGQLSMEDQARLEDGSEWKSLEMTMADAFDRSFVEVKQRETKSETSKRALTTAIKLLLAGYFAYQKHFVTNEPVWGWILTGAFFVILMEYFHESANPKR